MGSFYTPAAYITVNEQFIPTEGKCNMANKSDKFGIKFWLASDVKSKYVVHGFTYLGKTKMRPISILLTKSVVLKLIEPFSGCGRMVATDNFFTSSSLATKIL